MTPGELATRVLAYTDNVSSTDADYRPRRRRIIAWAQEVVDEVWQAADFPWKRARTTIVVGTGEYEALLPLDFGNIPAEGGVFDGAYRYEDVSQGFTSASREGALLPPTYSYSLYNYSTTSQRPTIQFPSVGPRTVVMYYNRKPPQLADRPHAPTAVDSAPGNVNGVVRYVITYVTEDGYEHEPGEVLAYTATNDTVTVTLPDPGPAGEHNVKYFKAYRTVAASTGPYQRVYPITLTFGIDTTFVDNNSDGTLMANGLGALVEYNVLDQIPSQYHHTVILPGVIARTRRSKGDTRNWEADYRDGLKRMIAQERQRKSTIQQVPRAISGMW